MVKVISFIFLFLGSLLHAHGGHNEHVHYWGTLHIVDVVAVAAGLLMAFLIYRNVIASR